MLSISGKNTSRHLSAFPFDLSPDLAFDERIVTHVTLSNDIVVDTGSNPQYKLHAVNASHKSINRKARRIVSHVILLNESVVIAGTRRQYTLRVFDI